MACTHRYTIHNHTKGECWLKHEANESHPIAYGPTLPLRMRNAPRPDWPWAVNANVWPWAVPERVSWQASLLARLEHAPPRACASMCILSRVWHVHGMCMACVQAGILAKRGTPVWKGMRLPDWHGKFCKGKHGPC